MNDTLEFARNFEAAGFDKAKAEALAVAMAKAHEIARQELVSKEYLDYRIKTDLAELKVDMVRWLFASQAAAIIILVALANFTRVFD